MHFVSLSSFHTFIHTRIFDSLWMMMSRLPYQQIRIWYHISINKLLWGEPVLLCTLFSKTITTQHVLHKIHFVPSERLPVGVKTILYSTNTLQWRKLHNIFILLVHPLLRVLHIMWVREGCLWLSESTLGTLAPWLDTYLQWLNSNGQFCSLFPDGSFCPDPQDHPECVPCIEPNQFDSFGRPPPELFLKFLHYFFYSNCSESAPICGSPFIVILFLLILSVFLSFTQLRFQIKHSNF